MAVDAYKEIWTNGKMPIIVYSRKPTKYQVSLARVFAFLAGEAALFDVKVTLMSVGKVTLLRVKIASAGLVRRVATS